MSEKVDDDDDPFLSAVLAGNATEVERIVKSTEDINSMCGSRLTMAAGHGQPECVRRILELGGDMYSVGTPNEDDEDYEDGEDPYNGNEMERLASTFVSDDYFDALLIAATKRHVETVRELMEYRLFEVPKSKNAKEDYGEFLRAAKERDFQRIGLLLESVEDKNTYLKGWKGHNIMNLCLFLGCPSSCLQTMVDHGIGVNGWDYNGYTPIMAAILGENEECVKFLLDHRVDCYDAHILQRISFHDDGSVRFYSDRGRELQLPAGDKWRDFYQIHVGLTALMYAAAMGNIPILRMMLKAAPRDISERTGRFERFEGTRPLYFAIRYATLEAAELIGEFEKRKEIWDENLLCASIKKDDPKMVDFILKRMVSGITLGFERSMLTCVMKRKPEYLEKIMNIIPSLNVKKRKNVFEMDGARSYFAAIENDVSECVDLFMKQPGFSLDLTCTRDFGEAREVTSFMFSCQIESLYYAKMFLDMGADVNATNIRGRTAAMFAAKENQIKSLEFLVDLKADFDIADNLGLTVFSAAVMADDGSALEYLLKTGVVLDGNSCLRKVHKDSFKYFGLRRKCDAFGEGRYPIAIKNILLLMRHGMFDWDWCAMVDVASLHNILFAAVTCGISPGKLSYNKRDYEISPLVFTVLIKDVEAVRYLLANHYFLPDDYRCLSGKESEIVKSSLTDLYDNQSADLAHLIEQLTLRPLSLKAWNVMTLSEVLAASSSSCPSEGSDKRKRNDKVDALPLPESLKDDLKMKSKNKTISQLCPHHWKSLGPRRAENSNVKFDDIVVGGEVVKYPALEKCNKCDCQCGGDGLVVKDTNDDDGIDLGQKFKTNLRESSDVEDEDHNDDEEEEGDGEGDDEDDDNCIQIDDDDDDEEIYGNEDDDENNGNVQIDDDNDEGD